VGADAGGAARLGTRRTLGWLAGSVAAATGFVTWEHHSGRVRTPHIPPELFRSRHLDAGLGVIVSTLFGIYGILFFVTLYLQRIQGYIAAQAGVRLLALSGVMGISAVIAGKAVTRVGARIPLFLGSLAISGGLGSSYADTRDMPPRRTEVGVSTPHVGITAGADRH
jgi:hypothetical protein